MIFLAPAAPPGAGLAAAVATGMWPCESALGLASREPVAVPGARKHTCAVLAAWGIPAAVIESARLAVSEMVTNAQQAMERAGMSDALTLRLLADSG